MKQFLARFLALWLVPLAAWAHPGHDIADFVSGFSHPFTGIDHLLVLLAVGFWAGRSQLQARWQVPVLFMVVMSIGLALGAVMSYLSMMEVAVAISLLAMALVIVLSSRIKPAVQLALTTVFALLHGLVHGQEWELTGSGMSAVLGILLASSLLLNLSVALGSYRAQMAHWLKRILVTVLTLSGFYLLML